MIKRIARGIKSTGLTRKLPRRLLASLLAVCMLFTLLPASALAEVGQGDSVTITAFDPLEEAVLEQTVPFGTALAELNLPETLAARGCALSTDTEAPPEVAALTVEGVVWEPDAPYEGAAGSYTFTASAEGYVCAVGIAWPTLTVTVEPETVPAPDPEPVPAPSLAPTHEPEPAPVPQPTAYEAAVALFAALPGPEAVADMTDDEKTALSAQIGEALDALAALPDEDFGRFVAEHTDYLENVQALQAALTGGAETMAASTPTVVTEKDIYQIYANGTAITIADNGSGGTQVTYGSGTIVANGDLSNYSIYGGTKSSDMTGNTKITMTGGKVYNVIGGSNGGTITGNTSVTIGGSACVRYSVDGNGGGTVTGSASVTIGGSAVIGTEGNTDAHINGGNGAVKGGTTVTIEGNAAIYGSVYGGYGGLNGYMVTVEGGATVNINDGTVNGSVYGGGGSSNVSATVTGDTKVTITGGTVNGSVYGGGNGSSYYDATVTGNTSVNISGGEVKGSVYGGGEKATAAVTGNSSVIITDGTVQGKDSNVYGGGYSAPVNGNSSVTISGNGVVDGYVSGGGYRGAVTGDSSVTLKENARVTASVCGGGYSAPVDGDSSVLITGGTVGQFTIFGGGGMGNPNATVGKNASVIITGGTVGGSVDGGGYLGTVGGTKTVTVGGDARIGGGGSGVTINGTDHDGYAITRGVSTFAIAPALTGAASVHVKLPASFASGTSIATGAVEGDLEKITLVGEAVTANPNLKAVLQGTEIVVSDHVHPLCDGSGEEMWTAWKSSDAPPSEAGSYYLAEDVTLTSTWEAPNGTNLCLNGHVLKGSGSSGVIKTAYGYSLNLCDCNGSNSTHKFAVDEVTGLWTLSDSGAETVTGGVVTGGRNSGSGGGVYVNSDSTFCLYGGTIAGNSANNGGGVYMSGGSFQMEGGAIVGNAAPNGGGVSVTSSGTFTLEGGAIRRNTATECGGGVYTSSGAKFTMNDGSIEGNRTTDASKAGGGGVYLYSISASLTMSGGSITGNSTAANGGGVYLAGGRTFHVSGTAKVTGNTKNSAADNVFLNGTGAVITVAGALTTGAAFGIRTSKVPTAGSPVAVTGENDADYSGFFTSDDSTYAIKNSGAGASQVVRLEVPHAHSWATAWSTDDTYHWHNCTAANCPITNNSGKDDYAAHDWKDVACTTAKTCQTCGKTEGNALGHILSYSASGNVVTEGCTRANDHTATATLALDSAVSLIYTGSAITPAKVTYSANWTGVQPTIAYENNTNSGNATASITIGGVTATLTFTIAAAAMTGVSAAGCTVTYDGAAHGITVTGAPDGSTVSYSLTEGSEWSEAQPEIKNATTGTTVYYKVSKANYADVTGSATVKIDPKEVTLSWSGGGETTYTGQPRSVTATVQAESLVNGDTCTVTVTDGSKTDAGEYTARATGLSNPNYKLPASGTTQDYKINPAPLTVSVKDDLTISKVYDGKTDVETGDVTDGLEIDGLQNNETATASGTWAYADAHAGTDKAVNVTGVSITFNGTAESKNYSFTAQDLSTTGEITRKPITPTITFAGGPWAYTGAAITPGYTVKDGGTALTTGDYTAVFSDNVDAGINTAKLKTTVKESGNYSFEEKTETFSIAPKEIAAVWGSVVSWEYDGDTHAPAATADTGVTGETVTLTADGAQTNYSADAYTATASISSVSGGQANAANYTLTNVTKDFTITQKEVGLDWSGHENLVYSGGTVNVTATAMELVENDTCDVTVTNGDKTDAGTYTAEATGLNNLNYKLPQGEGAKKEYTIAKAPVSFTVADNTYDYDASAKSATVEQTEGETPSVAGQFTVSYKQGQNPVDQPTSVGEYEIWVALDSGNFKFDGEQDTTRSKQVGTLTINGSAYPDQNKITWPTAGELTYGNPLSASTLTDGGTTSAGGNGTFTWKTPETIPTVSNNGYTVVFTPNDANYSTVEQTVSIAVKPKELTITGAAATNRDYVSGDRAVTVSGGTLEGVVSRNGVADDVALDTGKAAGTVETPDVGNDKAVTVTGYTLTGADAGNYTLKQPTGVTVDITPAQGSGSVTMEGWVYGGAAEIPVSVSATNGTERVTYRYTGVKPDHTDYDSEDIPTDAGSYTVTATFAAAQNYKESTATANFTIKPMPIMVQWKGITHVYDGGAKSPALVLVGVLEGDGEKVKAALSDGGKTDAGSYPVTVQLTGDRAFNYELTNPAGTFVIQKAPVIFTVTGDTVAHDGAAKAATVTATPNVAHTIVYKNRSGEIVERPTEAGNYEIWAALGSGNYRHADSTSGESRKIGVLTIYQTTPPAKYTVSFDPGEGEQTGNTAALDEALAGTLRVLPDCGFARDGWAFTGWALNGQVYQPGETIEQPSQNLTFTARWIEVVHEIGGMVDQEGKAVKNAVVTLMRGSRYVAETTTDDEGKFRFEKVTPGLYNLVGSYNGVVMTIKVLVEAEDVDSAEIHLPAGKTNSVVEVLAGTPEIVVGKLETVFAQTDDTVFTQADANVVSSGGTVEIKLTAQAVTADETDTQQTAIEEKTQNIGLYLDLSLKKTVTQANGTSSTTSNLPTSGEVLLESVVPLPADLQGKYRYTVHRLHDPDGDGPEQPTLDTLTETPNEAGEYIEVSEDKTILTIHAKDYSLYAIAWENRPSSGGGGGGPTVDLPIVPDAEHGTVKVSPERPSNGQKVTITPIPDEGYEVGTVTVTDKNGKELNVTDNGDGTWTFTQPTGSVTITVTFVPATGQRPAWNPFTDVKDGDWFHDSVKYVYEHGLMVGTSGDKFSPHLDTSRGMIVTILHRLEGTPENDWDMTFTDVKAGSYYYEAVRWAAEHEIVKGYTATTFGPDNTITRQELAAILHRYSRYKGADVSAADDLKRFTDRPDPWAEEAVKWAVGVGIISGKGDGVLDPGGKASRAQVAAMLSRFSARMESQ